MGPVVRESAKDERKTELRLGGSPAAPTSIGGGNAVPTVVNSEVCGANEIDNGGLTLGGDGSYERRFDWQDENGPNCSADHGRYRVQGNRIQ